MPDFNSIHIDLPSGKKSLTAILKEHPDNLLIRGLVLHMAKMCNHDLEIVLGVQVVVRSIKDKRIVSSYVDVLFPNWNHEEFVERQLHEHKGVSIRVYIPSADARLKGAQVGWDFVKDNTREYLPVIKIEDLK